MVQVVLLWELVLVEQVEQVVLALWPEPVVVYSLEDLVLGELEVLEARLEVVLGEQLEEQPQEAAVVHVQVSELL